MMKSHLSVIFALPLCIVPVAAQNLSPNEAKIAERAYIYSYPLVVMEATGAAMPLNHLTHVAEFPDANFRLIVRPNADTLYSTAWLDVSKEPLLLHVPDSVADSICCNSWMRGQRHSPIPGSEQLEPAKRGTQSSDPAGAAAFRTTSFGWMRQPITCGCSGGPRRTAPGTTTTLTPARHASSTAQRLSGQRGRAATTNEHEAFDRRIAARSCESHAAH